jgi:AmmeMemoRadiSam system protein B
MSTPASGAPTPPVPPKFDPGQPHQQRPKLRPVRGFPAQADGQMLLGLSDARQISDRVVFMAPAAQLILPLMDGQRSLEQIVSEVGRGLTREVLEPLVAQLDDAGLLFGPVFEAMLAKVKTDFDATAVLPPASTAAIADAIVQGALGENATDEQKATEGPKRLRAAFEGWMAQALEKAPNPSFAELPKAIVAPHIDYPRGWLNYGSVWGRMRVVDRPDRVVILGTNHFGEGTGVVGCDKGYQSPLGTCEIDGPLLDIMKRELGEKLFTHRYDHEREHSIELQIPWIQQVLGTDEKGQYCKVFGALIHDPTVNNGESYDGKGVGLQAFVDALRKAIAELPGRTLVVASADLSHVGPSFGDEKPLAGEEEEPTQFRNKVFQHDREMLELIRQNKPDELVSSMAWQQNPTRWCSVGNLVATMMVVKPREVQLLNYTATLDQQGLGMVSSAAIVMN